MAAVNRRDRIAIQSSATLSWKDVLTAYPVFDGICSYLSPRDIVNFQKTTKQLAGSFEILFKTQWNVNRSLARFVSNPAAFRSQMEQHNAIISGSFALQFFERVVWEDSDLDIYVYDGTAQYERALGKYLRAAEGYELEPAKPEAAEYHMMRGLAEVETYIRKGEAKKETRIQIIYTIESPVSTILTGFYTTAVVNIITWNAAYCIFPDATFSHRTYQLKPLSEEYGPRLAKYDRRGWTPLEVLWEEDKAITRSIDLKGYRHIGDSLCWKVSLDTTDITPTVVQFRIEYNQFTIHYINEYVDVHGVRSNHHYDIAAEDFKSAVLRYPYTYSRVPPTEQQFWLGFASRRLTELTYIELLKLDEEDRPFEIEPQWDYCLSADLVVRNTPAGWKFWDDQIPRWYEAFSRKLLNDTTT